MNKLLITLLLSAFLFTSMAWADVDVKQIHARNLSAEQGLMNLRAQQARSMLAGTHPTISWNNKVVLLKGSLQSISARAKGQGNNNWQAPINAGQQLIQDLAMKYSTVVYPNSVSEEVEQNDPLLNNFAASYKILTQMKMHPDNIPTLYASLQQNMVEMDNLISNTSVGATP